MKKIISFLTAFSMCFCLGNSLTANASFSHAIDSVENGDIAVEIDQITLSKQELARLNYQVPVFVRMTKNAGITEAEFGIWTEDSLKFKMITSSAESITYANTENIQDSLLIFSVVYHTTKNLTWCAWASETPKTATGNLFLMVLDIPHDKNGISGGEIRDGYRYYDIAYSETGSNFTSQLFKNSSDFQNILDYSDSVTYTDGWVRVPIQETSVIKGDADGNGEVDILDVITINKAIMGKEILPDDQIEAIDFNHNGVPDSSDSLTLLKMIVGLL